MQPTLAVFRSVAQHNHSRSRRHFLRARSLSPKMGLDVWGDEEHCVEPSQDEDSPLVRPDDPLNLLGHFPLSLSGLDPRLTTQSVNSPGGPLGSGSKKEPRTERDPGDVASVERSVRPCLDNELEADLADYGLFMSSADNRRLAPSPGGRLNAINFPAARWSSFRTPYGANHLSPSAIRCSTYFPPLPSGS